MPDDEMASEREFNENNIEEFRRNGGKVGGQFEGFPLLLLTSSGAKSGAERVNLIGYFDIDDKIYVVGSAAGRDQSPAWVFNLRAHPDVRSRSVDPQSRRRQRTAPGRTRPHLRNRQGARTGVRRIREAHRSRHPRLRTSHQGLINRFVSAQLGNL